MDTITHAQLSFVHLALDPSIFTCTYTKNTRNREIRSYCPSSLILDIHIQGTATYIVRLAMTSRDITDLVYGGGIGGHVTSLTWYMVGVLGVRFWTWNVPSSSLCSPESSLNDTRL